MIFLSCSNDMYTYNTYHLAKAFFPEEDVQQNVSEEMEDVFRITFPDGSVFVVKKEDIPAEEDRSRKKYAVDVALYKACREYTGKELAWGILTGVRPTKIAMQKQEQGMDEESFVKWFGEDSLVSPGKAALAWQIAGCEKKILGRLDYRDGYSLYVGIPFCPSVCSYCSFSSGPIDLWKDHVEDYLGALMKELEWIGQRAGRQGKKLNTVYIGGGTPTTLSEEQLERLLSCIDRCFSREHLLEYTVEAGRPDSITEGKLKVLRAHGITRISINPQTLEDPVLQAIGRRHSAQDILDAYALAREVGFDSINMDLIAGLPRDSFEGFCRSLNGVLALEPENITVHTLALKKGSRLMEQGGALPSGEETARMLDYSLERLSGKGYLPYYLYRQKYMSGSLENVGWCLSGQESVYNIVMMEELQTVVSIGGGGVTKLVDRAAGTIVRQPNPKYPHDYLAALDRVLAQKEELAAYFLPTEH